jgi:glutamate-5-semialdehyde dehydrogenase
MNTEQKNRVLGALAELLVKNQANIIEANQQDISACSDIDPSMLDRLKVDEKKVQGMVSAVEQAMELEDPEGKVLYSFQHDNGLKIENRSVPFGRILIIYESRPDVTIEAVITAFKAGNRILLKGGSEAKQTNIFLAGLWQEALEANGIDPDYVVYLDLGREETQALIKNNTHNVDLIIPRGGEGLINFVKSNTDIPVIISGRGNNFLFIDKACDFEMAISIALNGKSRLSVCNALDKVLIHKDLTDLERQIYALADRLKDMGIEVVSDVSEEVMKEEFLSAKMVISTVAGVDAAIETINKYSGGHSASIVTADRQTAEKFQREVDCSAVYHNASTRFTDGGQFGMGAEIAISTQKLHARGPIGIGELVTNKWFIDGEGQIRE